jgi:asparagine synthase (glutamine-hydrolysing)
LLDERRMLQQGILNCEAVQQLWREHKSGQRNHAYLLWNVLMLQDWLAHNPKCR